VSCEQRGKPSPPRRWLWPRIIEDMFWTDRWGRQSRRRYL